MRGREVGDGPLGTTLGHQQRVGADLRAQFRSRGPATRRTDPRSSAAPTPRAGRPAARGEPATSPPPARNSRSVVAYRGSDSASRPAAPSRTIAIQSASTGITGGIVTQGEGTHQSRAAKPFCGCRVLSVKPFDDLPRLTMRCSGPAGPETACGLLPGGAHEDAMPGRAGGGGADDGGRGRRVGRLGRRPAPGVVGRTGPSLSRAARRHSAHPSARRA